MSAVMHRAGLPDFANGMQAQSSEGAPPPMATDFRQQINILIVDDEPKNLTVLESILSDPGYRLVRATSGEEALIALLKEEFALIILDIRMPEMTGFDLARLVKERKKTADVPIIFLTAFYNDDQHVLDGYGSGAVDYLSKPINPMILRSKVAVFADLHRKSRALAHANESLLAENAQRLKAQEELRQLNDTLEAKVAERTGALRAVEQMLRDADARKDNFIATLAHELRNPLAPIRNAVALFGDPNMDATRLAWCKQVIERQVGHMARLLEELFDVSRVIRGKLTLRREEVDLKAIVERATETARPFIDGARHVLVVRIPDEPVTLHGDLIRLAQVISNLLINAAKYTDPGGRIELDASAASGQLEVRIKDNGIGIAAENLGQIFEMFGQVQSALDRTQGGLGVGLALARALVHAHRGEIRASSDGPGKGSEFVLNLPLAGTLDRHSAPAARSQDQRPPSAPAKKRILVADDLRDSADSLAILLQTMGHEVHATYDGQSAIKLAAKLNPDLAIIDIGMPKLNGYDTCRELRKLPNGRRMKIVALTGWGQQTDRELSQQAGFDQHLVKPVDPAAIDALLGLIK